MQKDMIIEKLRESGCRITKQRLALLDIILENDCSSCKEIYYKAVKANNKVGTATVYRMLNTLEEIGAISRKNLVKVAFSESCAMENACTIQLEDGSIHHLSAKDWNAVIRKGLKEIGYIDPPGIVSVKIRECECKSKIC